MAAFYLDEDVSLRLARLLIDRGHHVATTDEEGRKGAPDARQLLYAAARGWTLLTNNADHCCTNGEMHAITRVSSSCPMLSPPTSRASRRRFIV
jgi:hypothetical protein